METFGLKSLTDLDGDKIERRECVGWDSVLTSAEDIDEIEAVEDFRSPEKDIESRVTLRTVLGTDDEGTGSWRGWRGTF